MLDTGRARDPCWLSHDGQQTASSRMSMPMSNPQKPGAVLFAKDPLRIALFYESLLAMMRTHAEKGLIVLESSTQQLVIHGIPRKIAESIDIASPPARRINTAVKLIFPVDDIAECRASAANLGGGLDPKDKEFVARGFRACDGFDPKGNVFQLREPSS